MAQCKNCGKIGFSVTIPKYGICLDCLNNFNINYQLIYSVIQEIVDAAEKSNSIETITTQMDLAIQHMGDLILYDRYGIFEISNQLNELKNRKQALIFNELVSTYNKLTAEKNIGENAKTKLLKNLRSDIKRYYSLLRNYHSEIDTIYQGVEFEIAVNKKKKGA